MIDLHTHSTVSDGSDDPSAIPGLAAAAGCTAVALTDHDSVAGLAAARGAAEAIGIELVPGCELSCETEESALHMLVYFVDEGEGPLQDELGRLRDIRDERNRRMVETLAGLGLPVTWEELQAEAGGRGAGRPHAAALLMHKGVVASVQEAFDVWLAKGKPGYVEKERLTPARAIDLALSSGAVPVLAHPLTLGRGATLSETIGELAGLGLCGIEAWYGRYEPEEREMLAGLAAELDLVATGGSDHHGTYKPDLSVGTGRGDLSVPDECLTALKDRIPD